jgi:hypothetical protein
MADDVLLSVKETDFNGKSKTSLVYFAPATTLASVTTFAQAFAPLVEAVSESQVTALTVSLPIALPGGLKGAPGAGVRINAGGRFSFDTPGRYNFGLWIGAMKAAFVNVDDLRLDETEMLAVTAAISAGLSGVIPTDGNGIDVGAIRTGKYAFRK